MDTWWRIASSGGGQDEPRRRALDRRHRRGACRRDTGCGRPSGAAGSPRVGLEMHIGALLRRSYSLVVALLATLRAGCLYGVVKPLPVSGWDLRGLAVGRSCGCGAWRG